MKKVMSIFGITLILIMVSYGLGYACSTCGCQDAAKSSEAEEAPLAVMAAEHSHAAPELVVEVNNKVCPVMGNKIEEGSAVKVVYEGKIYNLCCPGCIESFKKDPKKYIEKINQELSGDSQ